MTRETSPNGAAAAGEPLRRVPLDMFKFATHDELYLGVMQVFGEANERLVTALTFDEVFPRPRLRRGHRLPAPGAGRGDPPGGAWRTGGGAVSRRGLGNPRGVPQ
jgi:hypothetical protein